MDNINANIKNINEPLYFITNSCAEYPDTAKLIKQYNEINDTIEIIRNSINRSFDTPSPKPPRRLPPILNKPDKGKNPLVDSSKSRTRPVSRPAAISNGPSKWGEGSSNSITRQVSISKVSNGIIPNMYQRHTFTRSDLNNKNPLQYALETFKSLFDENTIVFSDLDYTVWTSTALGNLYYKDKMPTEIQKTQNYLFDDISGIYTKCDLPERKYRLYGFTDVSLKPNNYSITYETGDKVINRNNKGLKDLNISFDNKILNLPIGLTMDNGVVYILPDHIDEKIKKWTRFNEIQDLNTWCNKIVLIDDELGTNILNKFPITFNENLTVTFIHFDKISDS
jgi:hypothetical protein